MFKKLICILVILSGFCPGNNRFLLSNQTPMVVSELKNYYNFPSKIGEPEQSINLAIDTTSPFTLINSSKYTKSSSKTASDAPNPAPGVHLFPNYDGVLTHDTLQVSSLKIPNFGFILYDDNSTTSKHIHAHDKSGLVGGVLGLGISSINNAEYSSYNTSLLSSLKLNNLISEKVYTMEIQKDGNFEFGIGERPDNYDKYSFCNLTSSYDLEKDYQAGWVCDLSHVLVGNLTSLLSGTEVSGRAIFDTTSRYIYAPVQYMSSPILESLIPNFNSLKEAIVDQNGDYSYMIKVTEVNDTLLNSQLAFVVGGNAYYVPLRSLVDYVNNNREFYEILIKFSPEKKNIWTLGLPFISNFAFAFDEDRSKVGIYSQESGKIFDLTEQYGAWRTNADKSNFLLIVFGGILGSVILLIIVLYIVHSIKRQRLEQHGPLIES